MADSTNQKIAKKPRKPKLEGAKYYAVVGESLSKQVAQLQEIADEETFRNYMLKLQVEMLQVSLSRPIRKTTSTIPHCQ